MRFSNVSVAYIVDGEEVLYNRLRGKVLVTVYYVFLADNRV